MLVSNRVAMSRRCGHSQGQSREIVRHRQKEHAHGQLREPSAAPAHHGLRQAGREAGGQERPVSSALASNWASGWATSPVHLTAYLNDLQGLPQGPAGTCHWCHPPSSHLGTPSAPVPPFPTLLTHPAEVALAGPGGGNVVQNYVLRAREWARAGIALKDRIMVGHGHCFPVCVHRTAPQQERAVFVRQGWGEGKEGFTCLSHAARLRVVSEAQSRAQGRIAE